MLHWISSLEPKTQVSTVCHKISDLMSPCAFVNWHLNIIFFFQAWLLLEGIWVIKIRDVAQNYWLLSFHLPQRHIFCTHLIAQVSCKVVFLKGLWI